LLKENAGPAKLIDLASDGSMTVQPTTRQYPGDVVLVDLARDGWITVHRVESERAVFDREKKEWKTVPRIVGDPEMNTYAKVQSVIHGFLYELRAADNEKGKEGLVSCIHRLREQSAMHVAHDEKLPVNKDNLVVVNIRRVEIWDVSDATQAKYRVAYHNPSSFFTTHDAFSIASAYSASNFKTTHECKGVGMHGRLDVSLSGPMSCCSVEKQVEIVKAERESDHVNHDGHTLISWRNIIVAQKPEYVTLIDMARSGMISVQGAKGDTALFDAEKKVWKTVPSISCTYSKSEKHGFLYELQAANNKQKTTDALSRFVSRLEEQSALDVAHDAKTAKVPGGDMPITRRIEVWDLSDETRVKYRVAFHDDGVPFIHHAFSVAAAYSQENTTVILPRVCSALFSRGATLCVRRNEIPVHEILVEVTERDQDGHFLRDLYMHKRSMNAAAEQGVVKNDTYPTFQRHEIVRAKIIG